LLRSIINWGGSTFLLALFWLGAGILLSFRFSLNNFPQFFDFYLPNLNIGFSLFLILLCQISYSRIHNSKIFLFGILLGLNGLVENFHIAGFMTITPSAQINYYHQFFRFCCLLLVCLLPATLKYSTIKKITLCTSLIYVAGILVWDGRLDKIMQSLVGTSGEPLPVYSFIGYGIPVLCTMLTFLFLRNQFYLGGVFAGLSVLLSSIWMREFYLADSASYYYIGNSLITLFLILGIIIHWIVMVSHNIVIDPLMQIYNRSYCNNIISEQSKVNTAPPFSVIMVDIDHFKKVNDVHGHQAGDTVLRKVAQTLKSSLGPKGILCRYGGEEIVIFISRTSQKQAEAIIEKARIAVKKLRVKVGKKSLKVTISAGISQRIKKNQSVESVISAADKAVYKAKKAGRDRIHTATVYSRKK